MALYKPHLVQNGILFHWKGVGPFTHHGWGQFNQGGAQECSTPPSMHTMSSGLLSRWVRAMFHVWKLATQWKASSLWREPMRATHGWKWQTHIFHKVGGLGDLSEVTCSNHFSNENAKTQRWRIGTHPGSFGQFMAQKGPKTKSLTPCSLSWISSLR